MNFLLLVALASTPRIDAYVSACPAPADGFVAPARGQATSLGVGTVREVREGRVEIAHCYFENHEVKVSRAVFEGLTHVEVKEGEPVTRGQRLGRGAKVSVRVDDRPAADFVVGRAHLVVPPREPVLVVVDVDGHRAVRFEAGLATHEWDVGHGQAEGVKEARGDLRTPRGLYFVVDRTTGPFGGAWADYFGEAWVKVNYPNAFDAARGLDGGVISAGVADAITAVAPP